MAEREELARSQWKKPTETTCEECGKKCATAGGLKNHITRMHKNDRKSENKCNKCETNFRTKSSLENHQKVCKGTAPDTCPHCNQKQSRGNLSRHINKCKMKESNNRQNNMNTNEGVLGNLPLPPGNRQTETRNQRQNRHEWKSKECSVCGARILATNMSRHRSRVHGLSGHA